METGWIIPWHKIPFVRLVLPFILGIALAHHLTLPLPLLITGMSILFLLFCISFMKTSNENGYLQTQHPLGVIILSLFVVLGMLTLKLKEHDFTIKEGVHAAHVWIEEGPEERTKTMRYQARVIPSHNSPLKGNVILYLPKDTPHLQIGDQLQVETHWEYPKNWNHFNYVLYLKSKNITTTAFVATQQYTVTGNKDNIYTYAQKCRKSIIALYKQCGIAHPALATLSALTLGEKEMLDTVLKQSFSNSGAMHILAVSGLHVGIIYVVLCFLLSFILSIRGGKYILAFLLIVFLWSYALLTGMSASVWRSVLMFSLFSLGKLFHQNTNSINTVAASAFIMLFIHPYFLFDVGFQLSFCAVTSIIYFYPKINTVLTSKWWVVKQLWSLTAVSLAAQIGTLPLTLYYFKQFPVYFLLSNLVVIACGALLLILFLLFLMSTVYVPIMIEIGNVLHLVTNHLNHAVLHISQFPFATIEWKNFTTLHILTYVTIVIVFDLSLHYNRRKKYGNN